MPRSRAQRKADTLAVLRTDCWVASADGMGNAHLVPLSDSWDGAALVLATPRSSPTATNLLRAGVARVGVGPTRDVVLVDAKRFLWMRRSKGAAAVAPTEEDRASGDSRRSVSCGSAGVRASAFGERCRLRGHG